MWRNSGLPSAPALPRQGLRVVQTGSPAQAGSLGSSGLSHCSGGCRAKVPVQICSESIQAWGQRQMCVLHQDRRVLETQHRSGMSRIPKEHKGLFVSLYPAGWGSVHLHCAGSVYSVLQTLYYRNQAVITTSSSCSCCSHGAPSVIAARN